MEGSPGDDCVTLSTVHGAKGNEWDIVFLIEASANRWRYRSGDAEAKETARRLFFVAVSRPKKLLHISYHRDPEASQCGPATFVHNMMENHQACTQVIHCDSLAQCKEIADTTRGTRQLHTGESPRNSTQQSARSDRFDPDASLPEPVDAALKRIAERFCFNEQIRGRIAAIFCEKLTAPSRLRGSAATVLCLNVLNSIVEEQLKENLLGGAFSVSGAAASSSALAGDADTSARFLEIVAQKVEQTASVWSSVKKRKSRVYESRGSPFVLAPNVLASYFFLSCDRFIHRKAQRGGGDGGDFAVPPKDIMEDDQFAVIHRPLPASVQLGWNGVS